jgi:hypothetical protein
MRCQICAPFIQAHWHSKSVADDRCRRCILDHAAVRLVDRRRHATFVQAGKNDRAEGKAGTRVRRMQWGWVPRQGRLLGVSVRHGSLIR